MTEYKRSPLLWSGSKFDLLDDILPRIGSRLWVRFWSHVDMSAGLDGCWPWTASVMYKGYGNIQVLGKKERAHRVAYTLIEDLRPGDVVRHLCHNRRCVNPTHLLAGSHQDNEDDKTNSDRRPWGEASGACRYSDQQIAEVRRARARGATVEQAAATCGMSVSHAKEVLRWTSRTRPSM